MGSSFWGRSERFLEIQRANSVLASRGVNLLGPFKTKLYRPGFFEGLRLIVFAALFPMRNISSAGGLGARACNIFFYERGAIESRSGNRTILSFKAAMADYGGVECIPLSRRIVVSSLFPFACKLIFLYWKFGHLVQFLSPWRRLVTLSCAARTLLDLDAAEPVIDAISRRGVVITFCDAIGLENLVAQVARTRAVRTVTLQHGQYRLPQPGLEGPDIEAFFNFVSDKILIWGTVTENEFINAGVSPGRLVKTGMFGLESQVLPPGDRLHRLSSSARKSHMGLIGVALSGPNSGHENVQLISFANNLATRLGVKVAARFHPADDLDRYGESIRCFVIPADHEYFDICEFTIMASTGFFMDCLHNGHPFWFYDGGQLPDAFRDSGRVLTSVDRAVETDLATITYDERLRLRELYDAQELKARALSGLFSK